MLTAWPPAAHEESVGPGRLTSGPRARLAQALRVCALALLMQACAATPGAEGSHRARSFELRADAPWGDSDFGSGMGAAARGEDSDERARQAEAERAVAQVWAVLGATEEVGAVWEFRYHAQGGALTLQSLRRLEEGSARGAPVDGDVFARRLTGSLPTLVGTRGREVTLTFRRMESSWATSFDASPREEPPAEARTLPVRNGRVPEETYQKAVAAARALERVMNAAAGGRATLEVEVTLADARLTGWSTAEYVPGGAGELLPASGQSTSAFIHALLPFTGGLGERTVRLKLEGRTQPEGRLSHWTVVEAQTLRPPPPPEEMEDFAREYRAMHERILREWREEVGDSAVLLAGFTAEQLAWWFVGGVVAQRAFVLFKGAAPTVTSVLSKGGTHAVRWFRALLLRMSPAERATLQRLWLRAETGGLEALSAAERAELRALMSRLEKLIHTAIDGKGQAKTSLRSWARKEYFEVHNPQLAKALGKRLMETYDVHHKIPLEYAHLFPTLDINARVNLAGVPRLVHESIGSVWSAVRPASRRITPDEVRRVAAIVDKHYGRWFDVLHSPGKSLAPLAQAENAAVVEVRALLGL